MTAKVSELAAPAIKPLVWRDHRPDSFPEPAWSAQTPFGFYNIEEVSASDSPAYVVRLHAHHFIADKDSLEEAKAAAQADYEKRIRSALVASPTNSEWNAAVKACAKAAAGPQPLDVSPESPLYGMGYPKNEFDRGTARGRQLAATAIRSLHRGEAQRTDGGEGK